MTDSVQMLVGCMTGSTFAARVGDNGPPPGDALPVSATALTANYYPSYLNALGGATRPTGASPATFFLPLGPPVVYGGPKRASAHSASARTRGSSSARSVSSRPRQLSVRKRSSPRQRTQQARTVGAGSDWAPSIKAGTTHSG